MNGRERVLALLSGRRPDRLPLMPITMMFAADRIGAKYRDYARDHRVLVEGQIATADTFDLDYVSAISDPAREASDLGADIEWFDNQPPAIVESRALLADKTRLGRLPVVPGPRMTDRIAAVRLLRERAGRDRIVEGWIEGPCAMAADLRGVNTLMLDFYDDPDFVRDLFAFVIEMEVAFARAQVEAGADLIGVGDAAASLVGPKLYQEFVQPYEAQLAAAIPGPVRLHICGKTRRIYAGMSAVRAAIVDLDFMNPMDEARTVMGPDQILLGNVDPVRVMRDGTPEQVEAAVAECHRHAGDWYIVGAGCEIPRGTPDANFHAMARYAKTGLMSGLPSDK